MMPQGIRDNCDRFSRSFLYDAGTESRTRDLVITGELLVGFCRATNLPCYASFAESRVVRRKRSIL